MKYNGYKALATRKRTHSTPAGMSQVQTALRDVVKRNENLKFNVNIDRDEDGIWIVECPSIPGCVSQGNTKDEALINIEDAIRLCLEVRAERGMLLTVETRQVEVVA